MIIIYAQRQCTSEHRRNTRGAQPGRGAQARTCNSPRLSDLSSFLSAPAPIMIPLSVLRRQLPRLDAFCLSHRSISATTSVQNAVAREHPLVRPHTIDPRWLTLMKRRIGRCMMFGLKPDQINEGGKILQQLARDWRELIAGSEGFLTDEKRRSLYRHNVVWGEMV